MLTAFLILAFGAAASLAQSDIPIEFNPSWGYVATCYGYGASQQLSSTQKQALQGCVPTLKSK
jgi:hypothetical protein